MTTHILYSTHAGDWADIVCNHHECRFSQVLSTHGIPSFTADHVTKTETFNVINITHGSHSQ